MDVIGAPAPSVDPTDAGSGRQAWGSVRRGKARTAAATAAGIGVGRRFLPVDVDVDVAPQRPEAGAALSEHGDPVGHAGGPDALVGEPDLENVGKARIGVELAAHAGHDPDCPLFARVAADDPHEPAVDRRVEDSKYVALLMWP